MGPAIQTIPIRTLAAQAGCGSCLHHSGAAECRAVLGEVCLAPVLQGPPEALQRVMNTLGRALGFEAAADAGAGRVVSLSVRPGEVDLVLAGGAACGAGLADAAFQALRGLLPDTDIYVRNAA